ncbi:MAG: hypothetical protein ABJB86_01585 [Bacteroidota bacterium]
MDKKPKKSDEETPKVYGDPVYGPNEDIYAQGEKIGEVGDDKKPAHKINSNLAGEDLDIPGAELDDEDEGIGEEDEENNYYSLGGDNHEDLEETKED